MSGIEVVRESDLRKGDSTDGIVRRRAFDSENTIVSQSRVAAGVVSGWHHYGARDLFGFVVNGQLRLESAMNSPGGVDLNSGDFFHIPAGLVHRDLNPDKTHDLVVVNVLVGQGPSVVNVRGPSDGEII